MERIICKDLTKEYRTGSNLQLALDHVNVTIEKGEYIAVVGRSGSGKSTLMNILGLIDTPTEGNLLIDDQDVLRLSDGEKAALRNRMIGYVFQAFYLEPDYTVYRNLEIPLLIAGVPHASRNTRIHEALQAVGMEHKLRQRANTLSGGEKQRVSIARALVNQPELILADEPCGNLDSENTAQVMDIFDRLHAQGKTIVLITHSGEDASRAQRQIRIKDGRVEDETE